MAYNLILTAALFIIYYPIKQKDFIRFAIFLFIAGFAVEMIGVQTGKIFGSYHYGYALGFKLKDVPLIIGLNWVILILATQTIASRFTKNIFNIAVIGATLMVLLDVLIEQIASTYQFWHWQNDIIPLQNYIAWFVISFFFHGLGASLKFEKSNPLAIFIFALQFIFFAALNLLNILK